MSERPWHNWARTVSCTPARVARPESVAEIAETIAGARRDGLAVRPRGSGHSFTPAAEAPGVAVDLFGWRGLESVERDTGLVTVRSGTTIRELNAELDRHGLAMTNLGDIDKQTISGAISTGTHGTGAQLGGLATQVAALELVLADGSVVTCSAGERPDLFAAARVGLGALGVISRVTLRCEPSFVLAAEEVPVPVDEVFERFHEEAAANDHFEFYWFPGGGRTALVKRNNRLPLGAPARPLSRARQFVEYEMVENRLFNAVCAVGRAVPPLVGPITEVFSRTLSPRTYSDTSHRVFVTNRNVRFVESEYAVPRESIVDVLRELRARVPKLAHPVIFPAEVRVAAADDIWLSTAYLRNSAYIAIHQYTGMPFVEYFRLFSSIVGEVGGRPHWGKMHLLDAERLRERYPRFDDFLRVRSTVDPDGVFANPYTDRVLGPAKTLAA
ncbi:FAD-linked oxidoreductase [Herbihabitans rhizosphaerae]|uniref:FAD-linked oxidoreductase n=1 Tax=Herbihabitans rhizosphaerae TaxID=1872711 RepID=A0A4Q7KMJ0_9PSEU|nr:D-arabinono-1,4-lactone oxidase [Herbihabitans rhizosphaerae]RZS37526.1 FAD-linked oxidoreductase [Herbihabitans rhizosphaerae]